MQSAIKRLIDLLVATGGLLLCAPMIIVIAVVIRIALKEPPLFRQTRIGVGESRFDLLKFRTMRTATDSSGHLLPDAERLTKLGTFLRGSSLDELPQLWNILCGDMSLVGPRPLLPQYLPRYSAHQRRRHEVKPGITGWAQIHGRNEQSWEQRFNLDVWYVEHWSLLLDFTILMQTGEKVLRREGIAESGQATKVEFMGDEGRG